MCVVISVMSVFRDREEGDGGVGDDARCTMVDGRCTMAMDNEPRSSFNVEEAGIVWM